MGGETRQIPGLTGYVVDELGEIYSLKFGRLRRLGGWLNNHGYRTVSVSQGGHRSRVLVHRAVAMAFHGLPPAGTECRHLDGDKTNNQASNLAWGTRSENMRDSLRHGTHVSRSPWKMVRGDCHPSRLRPERLARGERVGGATLTERHVLAIRALANLGFTISKIALVLEAPRGAVKGVVQGKTWAHVAKIGESHV